MESTLLKESCALCQFPLQSNWLRMDEDNLSFCCKGCQVVYQILESQNSLENYQDHPVFQQAFKSGLITNPNLEYLKKEDATLSSHEFQKLHLIIDEMWCPSCAYVIHLILMREKGVKSCVVDYSTDLASIQFTARFISKEKILRLISQMGYVPRAFDDPRNRAISRSLLLRFIVAAFFSLNIMMFSYPIYATYFGEETEGYASLFAWLSLYGSLPVIFYSAWPIWRRFYTGLRVGVWGMEALVCLGVSTATFLSVYELLHGSPYVYFDSMSVIIVFVLLGKIIESRAKFSAKDALVKLTLSLPRKGRKKFPNGEERFVPIKEIVPGDTLIVNMGEKIVLDGVVINGKGGCDESIMTGEAMPVEKNMGDSVLAGSVLQQGHLVIQISATLEQTALHQIIEMVSQEMSHKSQSIKLVDQLVRWFVPIVFVIAILTGISCWIFGITDGTQTVMQTAMIRMISVLLISCPCAIGIAAPLVEAYVLNNLAKMGVIVRNRQALSFLGKETVFVFDKTGTVTEGKFEVCQGMEALNEEQKSILKGLVSQSMHPISQALNQALSLPGKSFEKLEEFVAKGIKGTFLGESYYLGSKTFITEQGIVLTNEGFHDSTKILSAVYFCNEKKCLTTLLLGDRLRSGIKEFITSLSLKTLLISGDGAIPVEKVAKACGIQEWFSGQYPIQKKEFIERLKKQGDIVAMLGDGINDAPALTTAHVGIAVVSASDISIQVSDLLLTTGNFHMLTHLQKIARLSHRIIKQNLFWAFFYNCCGIGLAIIGWLSPLFAASAMVVSSLIVLFNAQRINSISKGEEYE
ncbi:MAG: heavy metal translocating P-type ATPase [Parachlamydiaceae bacterium]|nr:heavy metal translocating P-type ATPase [Parachlamydiaceae bacterium]